MIKFREYFTPFLSFVLTLFLSLLIVSLKSGAHFTAIVSEFISNLYIPDKNLFKVEEISGINTYIYLYISCAGSLIITFLVNALLTKKSAFFSRAPLLHAALALFITVFCLQTIDHISEFKEEVNTFHNAPLQKRIATRFENSYNFAQYCKTRFPGKHYGKPITDSDITKTKGMLTFFGIAYYLYPIDVRLDKENPKDCLIIFLKKNPLDGIPGHFIALDKYDKSSLIAIKKMPQWRPHSTY